VINKLGRDLLTGTWDISVYPIASSGALGICAEHSRNLEIKRSRDLVSVCSKLAQSSFTSLSSKIIFIFRKAGVMISALLAPWDLEK
jgi:hypothetical protein